MREVVRKSRARTLVAKDLPGPGSGKEGSGMSSADEPAHLVALAAGVGLMLRGSELGPKGCSHVGEGGIR